MILGLISIVWVFDEEAIIRNAGPKTINFCYEREKEKKDTVVTDKENG